MVNGGFIVKLEIDIRFLNKTRLTPFVIENAVLELTFQKTLSVLAREKECTSTGIDTAHFVIKSLNIQHQSILPSEKLWEGMVNLSEASTDAKKMGLPTWPVQQRVYFDPKSIPKDQSSVLNHIRGREIPERLFLFFTRKNNFDTTASNNSHLDFPEIKSIRISSNSNSSRFINHTYTSPFANDIKGITYSVKYNAENEFKKSCIDIHLNQISLNNLKTSKGLPILEDSLLAYTPYFSLHRHFFLGINLVTAVTGKPIYRAR